MGEALSGDVGRILRLRKWTNYFRPPPEGVRPKMRLESETCEAHEGRVLVAVMMGSEPSDGSEPLDVNAVLQAMGWTLPQEPGSDATPPDDLRAELVAVCREALECYDTCAPNETVCPDCAGRLRAVLAKVDAAGEGRGT